MSREPIRIYHPDWGEGYLEEVPGIQRSWKAVGSGVNADQLRLANLLSANYEYSAADGPPGYVLADQVAAWLPGCRVEAPPVPPTDPDMVY